MGGLKDWRVAAVGIVVQEGRFVQDEYEPRDKKEVKGTILVTPGDADDE